MDNLKKEFLLYNFKNYRIIQDEKKLNLLFNYHFNKFDYNFYINFYKDLNHLNFNDAYNHWKKYGKNEERVYNLFQSQYHLAKHLLIISNYKNLNFYKEEKKINILIRTSNREKYFNQCLNSILNQNYNNYNIFVSYDNLECKKYLNFDYDHIKYIYIDKEKYNNQSYFYNDYLNILNKEVEDGFIFYLDDDDMFTNNNCLKILNEKINNINDLLVFKFLRPDKCIFPKKIKNIRIGQIGTSCFCVNSKFTKNILWEKKRCGDFYYFRNLINNNKLNIKKIDFIIAKTIYYDKSSNFGL
jgi:hypothetical protein